MNDTYSVVLYCRSYETGVEHFQRQQALQTNVFYVEFRYSPHKAHLRPPMTGVIGCWIPTQIAGCPRSERQNVDRVEEA